MKNNDKRKCRYYLEKGFRSFFQDKAPDLTIKFFQEAIDLNPKDDMLWTIFAVILYSFDLKEGAGMALEQALNVNHSNRLALLLQDFEGDIYISFPFYEEKEVLKSYIDYFTKNLDKPLKVVKYTDLYFPAEGWLTESGTD